MIRHPLHGIRVSVQPAHHQGSFKGGRQNERNGAGIRIRAKRTLLLPLIDDPDQPSEETIQGLLIDDVDPPLKGDKIKVVRDTKWVPLGAATTTSKGHDEPTSTGDPQPTETEDSANVATAHIGLVLVSIATILFIF